MDGLRQRVLSGMLSNGLKREYAEQIYKTIEGFSSYGFPESHAASFALLTYASCYLKHHHPDAFTCALLNSQPMGFYSPRQLIADAQRHGVRFLALDIQHSEWDFTLEEPPPPDKRQIYAIRTGLRSIHGIKEEQAHALVEERKRGGPFRDLTNLVQRSRLPRASLIRLAAAGAFASFGRSVRETLWMLQGLCFDPHSLLFGEAITEHEFELESIPNESDWQSVQREYLTKGFSIESHPIAVLRPWLNELSQATPGRRYATAKDLTTLRHAAPVKVAGLMSMLQKPPTAKGMCFISLEDETGIMNLLVTPDLYQKYRLTLLHSPLLEAEGKLEVREGVRHVRLQTARALLGGSAPDHGPTKSISPVALPEGPG